MVDKKYCMSSYLAFRYIEKDNVDFYEETKHYNFVPPEENQRIYVSAAKEIDEEIALKFREMKGQKLGLMLSGGMDSASLASYMPGGDAYTFRFLGGEFETQELKRAEYFADYYHLNLHYVDIDWDTVTQNLVPVMKAKGAPVHSIEPQLYQAALQAKRDGIQRLIVGESADLIFGGMDQLLSEDWKLEDFRERYIFTKPQAVLREPADVSYVFERYRQGEKIDFLTFMDDIFSIESSGSYFNAFGAAHMPYTDPYANFKMRDNLDLYRVRHGEPKYLIRELFAMKYPGYPIPQKVTMPRPVDAYFKGWEGPKREEFRKDIEMSTLTGNQKWQLYCLEEFLNLYEPGKDHRL
ncbi:MAG: asparagine synthase C-terminal domain-containing protein [Clostridium sp.]|nr:asparagine synthase C-terminal domain-containing protein [Clostridium sp.]